MQSCISHPRGTVFYHLINFLSKSYLIDLLRNISEIVENNIFSDFRFTENMIFQSVAENQEVRDI